MLPNLRIQLADTASPLFYVALGWCQTFVSRPRAIAQDGLVKVWDARVDSGPVASVSAHPGGEPPAPLVPRPTYLLQ